MPRKLSQNLRARAILPPQDISTIKTGVYFDVSGSQRIMAAVTSATVLATKRVTLQFMQATDAAGTGAKVLGDPVVKIAPTGGATLDFTADASVEAMDKAYSFVTASLVSDNGSAVYASAVMILGNNRYNP